MYLWQTVKEALTIKEIMTLVAGILVGFVFKLAWEKGFGVWAIFAGVLLAAGCLILIANRIFDLNMSVEDLRKRLDIEIKYMDRESEKSEIAMYQEFTELVGNATKTIFVVNSYLVEHSGTFDSASQPARDGYYNALLERADRGVEYNRILQVKPDNSTLRELVHNEDHIKHFKQMIERKDQKHCYTAIKRAPAKRLSTFILIDEVYLIWQINEVLFRESHEYIRLHGAFVIFDPQQKITPHFKDYYKALDRSSSSMDLVDLTFYAAR